MSYGGWNRVSFMVRKGAGMRSILFSELGKVLVHVLVRRLARDSYSVGKCSCILSQALVATLCRNMLIGSSFRSSCRLRSVLCSSREVLVIRYVALFCIFCIWYICVLYSVALNMIAGYVSMGRTKILYNVSFVRVGRSLYLYNLESANAAFKQFASICVLSPVVLFMVNPKKVA